MFEDFFSRDFVAKDSSLAEASPIRLLRLGVRLPCPELRGALLEKSVLCRVGTRIFVSRIGVVVSMHLLSPRTKHQDLIGKSKLLLSCGKPLCHETVVWRLVSRMQPLRSKPTLQLTSFMLFGLGGFGLLAV